jgi:hypothetical protein
LKANAITIQLKLEAKSSAFNTQKSNVIIVKDLHNKLLLENTSLKETDKALNHYIKLRDNEIYHLSKEKSDLSDSVEKTTTELAITGRMFKDFIGRARFIH